MRALAFLGFSIVAAALAGLRLGTPTTRDIGWLVAGAACVAAVLVGERMNRSLDRRAWMLVAAGIGLVAAGGGADLVLRLLDRSTSFPAPVAPLYIVGAALLGLGMLRALRVHDASRSRVVVIDSVVVTGAAATGAWVLLVEPNASDVLTSPWTAAAVGGMFAALVLLGLAVCMTGLVRAVTPASAAVFVGGGLLVATLPFAAVESAAPYAQGGIVDALWLVALGLIGAAALDPSMAMLGAAEDDHEPHLRRAWFAALVSLSLVPATMLVVESVRGGHLGLLVSIAASVLLVVLVVLRLGDVLEVQKNAIEREHVMGAGAARLAAVRSYDELEEVATETARELVGRDAWVVFGDKPLPAAALEGRRFAIDVNGERVGEIAVSAGRLAPDNVRSLERLATQVAHAIEGVRLLEQRAAGRSEVRFRSLVQNSSDLIAVIDEEGAFTYLAPSVQSVLGYDPDELVGVQFVELLDPDERPAIETTLAAARRSTGNCTLDLRTLRRDGSW